MKYIETLHEGERLSGIYLCKYRQSAMTKNGKSYENVILQDKTGVIDAKIWDPNSQGIEDFDMLDYIDVVGDVTSFQGALQVSIKRVRKAREGEYIEEDYLPVSERNIDEMYEELLTYVHKIENPYLKQLTDCKSAILLKIKLLSKRSKDILRQRACITDLWADFWSIP